MTGSAKPIAAATAFQKADGFRCRATHPTPLVWTSEDLPEIAAEPRAEQIVLPIDLRLVEELDAHVDRELARGIGNDARDLLLGVSVSDHLFINVPQQADEVETDVVRLLGGQVVVQRQTQ